MGKEEKKKRGEINARSEREKRKQTKEEVKDGVKEGKRKR